MHRGSRFDLYGRYCRSQWSFTNRHYSGLNADDHGMPSLTLSIMMRDWSLRWNDMCVVSTLFSFLSINHRSHPPCVRPRDGQMCSYNLISIESKIRFLNWYHYIDYMGASHLKGRNCFYIFWYYTQCLIYVPWVLHMHNL